MQSEINKEKSFTLVEIFVSMAIFILVILMAVGIMSSSLLSKQRINQIKEIEDNSRYVLELMAREIRMGKIDSSESNSSDSEIDFFDSSGASITLCRSDQDGNCDSDGDYMAKNNNVITSNGIKISGLIFSLNDFANETNPSQPRVTISMAAELPNNDSVRLDFQNTISPRERIKVIWPEVTEQIIVTDIRTWDWDSTRGEYWCQTFASPPFACCSSVTPELSTGATDNTWSRTYVKIDLSSLPNNIEIISAKLYVYVRDTSNNNCSMHLGVYFVPDDTWIDKSFNAVPTDEWPTNSIPSCTTFQWVSWDITLDVQQECSEDGDKIISEVIKSWDDPRENIACFDFESPSNPVRKPYFEITYKRN